MLQDTKASEEMKDFSQGVSSSGRRPSSFSLSFLPRPVYDHSLVPAANNPRGTPFSLFLFALPPVQFVPSPSPVIT